MDELQQSRDTIDQLDKQLVELLAERYKITQKVGLYKAKHGLVVRDLPREKAQAERVATLAKEHGLDPVFAQEILNHIIDHAVKGQEAARSTT